MLVTEVAPMRKLLVVDDDRSLVGYICAVMDTQSEFAVTTAFDGVTGLDAALADPPDVVLLDITMPRRDGLTVLRMLKADPRTERTRVIIMTGVPSDHAKATAMQLGAEAFMPKPFSPSALLSLIAKASSADLARA
jgi:DNA-binding response OmpR family regulator